MVFTAISVKSYPPQSSLHQLPCSSKLSMGLAAQSKGYSLDYALCSIQPDRLDQEWLFQPFFEVLSNHLFFARSRNDGLPSAILRTN